MTNPTRPHTRNTSSPSTSTRPTVCHHLNPSIPEDPAFAESRIRPSTMAAEDVLHDLGAISIIGSDSQAMGRIGETIIRTWKTAHVMKRAAARCPRRRGRHVRARRYVAKYTIGPAVTHGLDAEVGSVEPGKLADRCSGSRPFRVRPHLVLKAGVVAWAAHRRRERVHPDPQRTFRGRARRVRRESTSVRPPLVAALGLDAGPATGQTEPAR